MNFSSLSIFAQGCNTNVTICTSGIAGPFTFNTAGPSVSTCLDFLGPNYAYIVLYITQSGPLEILIDRLDRVNTDQTLSIIPTKSLDPYEVAIKIANMMK